MSFMRLYHACLHLSGRGEHGRHLGEDTPSRRRGFFRSRLSGGVAGQQNEKEVSGLEEKTTPRQTIGNTEEDRLVLNR